MVASESDQTKVFVSFRASKGYKRGQTESGIRQTKNGEEDRVRGRQLPTERTYAHRSRSVEKREENERTFRNDTDLVSPIAEAGDVVLDVAALCEFALEEVALVQEQDDLSSRPIAHSSQCTVSKTENQKVCSPASYSTAYSQRRLSRAGSCPRAGSRAGSLRASRRTRRWARGR